MARDFRNDILAEIKHGLAELDPDVLDKVSAVVTNTLDKYEITERSTEIVPYDTGNLALMKTYAGSLVIDGKAKSTIAQYVRELKKFVAFLGNKDLKAVTTFDVRNYLAQEKVRGISNRTLDSVRTKIYTFYSWLTAEEYIPKNPCVAIKPIKYSEEIKKAFTSVELDILRSHCKNEKERAIIELLVSSGVRVSELISLDVSDIDFRNRSVHVRHGKGDKERYTYMDAVACDHLIKYLTKNGIVAGALFRSQRGVYTTDGIRKMLNVIAKRADIEDVHPHRFRRTFATRLASRGMDIQEIQRLMGHTNINTTMVYVAMDDSQVHNSYRKYSA